MAPEYSNLRGNQFTKASYSVNKVHVFRPLECRKKEFDEFRIQMP